MARKKILLDFLAAADEIDLDRMKDLWSEHSSDIARRMHKIEVLETYDFFERHGMNSERDELYDLATRYNHSASQALIAVKYIRG